MPLGADDPKLTAYALGELDAAERGEVEALLAADPAARAVVAEVRRTAGLLSHDLAVEEVPKGLTPLQRARLEDQAGRLARSRTGWQGARWWLAAASAAAAMVVLAVGYAVLGPQPGGPSGGPGQGGLGGKGGNPRPVAVSTPPDGRSGLATTGEAPHPIGTPPNSVPAPDRATGPRGWGAHSQPAGGQAFRPALGQPVCAVPLDAGEGSYAHVRRVLMQEGRAPAPEAVRTEEMINYFPYDYAGPKPGDGHPVAIHADTADCPWNARHRLLRVAIKARELGAAARPACSLVFLVDVSGSMARPGRLPVVTAALKALAARLTPRDRLAIVIYAGECGVLLDATAGDRKDEILAAVETLHAGGSTEGPTGTIQAYELAQRHFIRGGVNRVVVCTDDDFNVGMGGDAELLRLVEDRAAGGTSLSVLAFGAGGGSAARMRALAQAGGGDWACIETAGEAERALADQLRGRGTVVARDVRAEVRFNPARVQSYRLIGYDSAGQEPGGDGEQDPGLLTAGQTVTALYEIIPAAAASGPAAAHGTFCEVTVAYASPAGDAPGALTLPVEDTGGRMAQAPADFRFAAAVAAFGMIHRDPKSAGGLTLEAVLQQAKGALGSDPFGFRAEFLRVVDAARRAEPGR